MLLGAVSQVIDLVLFKEIRLYQDRIVKVWELLGQREIGLTNATLTDLSSDAFRSKRISNQTRRWLPGLFNGISYDEDLPDPEDVKKLNRLLAALSGRSVRELRESVRLVRLIKEGHTPPVIDEHVLDQGGSLQDMSDQKFDRIAYMGIFIYALPLAIFFGIVFYLLFRRNLW